LVLVRQRSTKAIKALKLRTSLSMAITGMDYPHQLVLT
jgi:hypothetical protein